MNKAYFYHSIMALGINLNAEEMTVLEKVLDPEENDWFDLSLLIKKANNERYKQEILPELRP